MAVNISVALNKGVYCITLMKDGFVIDKSYGKYISSSTYSDFIQIANKALLKTRGYLNSGTTDDEFIFEFSNSIFIKWVDNLYARDEYQEEFSNFLELLHSLPIRYRFVHNPKPLASQYLKAFDEASLKPKLSSLDI